MPSCLINDSDYRQVLIKDLKKYLKRDDYLSGFTPNEQRWIRLNIDAIGSEELDLKVKELISGLNIITYDEFIELKTKNNLVPGTIYGISNFRTIYQSFEKNSKGKYITWGNKINPSKEYLLLTIALNKNTIASSAYLYGNDELFWTIKYNPTQETLDDGEQTRGRIIYMEDNNNNKATYDFKNILFKHNNKLWHTFSDENGKDNSKNCYNNDICFSYNLIFDSSVNNINCTNKNNIFISGIDISDYNNKQIIFTNNKHYLDYLDLETLTHQFYELENIRVSS